MVCLITLLEAHDKFCVCLNPSFPANNSCTTALIKESGSDPASSRLLYRLVGTTAYTSECASWLLVLNGLLPDLEQPRYRWSEQVQVAFFSRSERVLTNFLQLLCLCLLIGLCECLLPLTLLELFDYLVNRFTAFFGALDSDPLLHPNLASVQVQHIGLQDPPLLPLPRL